MHSNSIVRERTISSARSTIYCFFFCLKITVFIKSKRIVRNEFSIFTMHSNSIVRERTISSARSTIYCFFFCLMFFEFKSFYHSIVIGLLELIFLWTEKYFFQVKNMDSSVNGVIRIIGVFVKSMIFCAIKTVSVIRSILIFGLGQALKKVSKVRKSCEKKPKYKKEIKCK